MNRLCFKRFNTDRLLTAKMHVEVFTLMNTMRFKIHNTDRLLPEKMHVGVLFNWTKCALNVSIQTDY